MTNADGDLNGAEVVMQQAGSMVGGLTLESPTFTSIRYTPTGMLNGAVGGTFLLRKSGCTSTTGTKARQIAVAATGRVSTTKVNCS